jgi:hypothetical protein
MVGIEFGGTDSSDRLKPEKGVAMVSGRLCALCIMLESLSHTLVVAYIAATQHPTNAVIHSSNNLAFIWLLFAAPDQRSPAAQGQLQH